MAQMDPAKKPAATAPAAPAAAAKPPAAPQGVGAGAIVESPRQEMLVKEDEAASRSAPASPATPGTTEGRPPHNISPGQRGSNLKAQAFADAHLKRVETEAQVYIDGEVRKAEAHTEKLKAVSEKTKMQQEAQAIETLKKEEYRADAAVQAAILKADKIVADAKQSAIQIKATAKETCEKQIANAATLADSEKAAHEEAKSRRMAEIKDKAETMIASGETIPTKASLSKTVSMGLRQKLGCVSPVA